MQPIECVVRPNGSALQRRAHRRAERPRHPPTNIEARPRPVKPALRTPGRCKRGSRQHRSQRHLACSTRRHPEQAATAASHRQVGLTIRDVCDAERTRHEARSPRHARAPWGSGLHTTPVGLAMQLIAPARSAAVAGACGRPTRSQRRGPNHFGPMPRFPYCVPSALAVH